MKEWTPAGYPQEYLSGLQLTDDEAIAHVLGTLSSEAKHIEQVVVEQEDNAATVYLRRDNVLKQVNWAEPEKIPSDYDEYARTFWSFSGPIDIQTRRSLQLAEKLHTGLTIRGNTQTLSIPSLGIKLEGVESYFGN